VQWFYIVFGLGLVQSFGYWCTDFLVVQRALAAEDLAASQRTPLIAAFPKLLYGVLAILPGLIALSVLGPKIATAAEANNAVPYAMAYYFPTGMLGFGLTALLAAFMSGMAGNITAFNTDTVGLFAEETRSTCWSQSCQSRTSGSSGRNAV